jgi:hypothetical protein
MKFFLTFEEFISESQNWKEALKKAQKKITFTEDSLLKNAQRVKSQYGTKEVQDRFDMEKVFGQFLSKEKNDTLNITDYNLKHEGNILIIDVFINDSKIPNISADFDVNSKVDIPYLIRYQGHDVLFYSKLPTFNVYNIDYKSKLELKYMIMDFIMIFYAWWEIADYTYKGSFSGGNPNITKKQMRGNPISWDDFKKYY